MKNLIVTIGLLLTGMTLNAQGLCHCDNFDGNLSGFICGELVIEFDTTHGANSWQIGQAQKTVFNQAYSLPNALMTDTMNFYPIHDTSILTVKVPVCGLSNYAQTISFYYKLNTDSLADYGKLEVSADDGLTFIDVLKQWDDYGFFWIYDTLESFTGNTSDWTLFEICVSSLLDSFPYADTVQYRFTFISDGNQTNKDGWIIDDLFIYEPDNIQELITNTGSNCYPNPTRDCLNIEYEFFKNNTFKLELYNDNGKLLKTEIHDNRLIILDLREFKSGIYFYRIIDKINNFQTFNKFVLNK